MDNDDQLIGRVLSRREVLALLGASGMTMLAACGPQQSGSVAATSAPTSAAATSAPTGAAATSAPTAAVATSAPTSVAGGATTAATAAATTGTNAEGQTAVAMASAPAAQAESTAQIATAEVANTTVAVPACVVRPEVTEGPYYVQEDLVRSDIRSDPSTGTAKEGIPLVLTFNVSQVSTNSCTAFSGATIEVWHCDDAGTYSDVTDPGFTTTGQKWLRGSQVTDANGKATFTTIYPGWYASRAVHIHYKVHPDTTKVFTSQLFFDDKLSDEVFTQAPYATAKSGTRDTLNSTDSIYQDLMLLTVNKTATGYETTFDIGLDLSTIGTGDTNGGGGPGGAPGGTPPSGSPPNGTRGPGGPPSSGTQASGTAEPTATP